MLLVMRVCKEILLWLILKEPQFQSCICILGNTRFDLVFKLAKVRWAIMVWGKAGKEKSETGQGVKKEQCLELAWP